MKKQTQKDKRIRKLFNKRELNHIILKSIVKNENLPLVTKWNAILNLRWVGTADTEQFNCICKT